MEARVQHEKEEEDAQYKGKRRVWRRHRASENCPVESLGPGQPRLTLRKGIRSSGGEGREGHHVTYIHVTILNSPFQVLAD